MPEVGCQRGRVLTSCSHVTWRWSPPWHTTSQSCRRPPRSHAYTIYTDEASDRLVLQTRLLSNLQLEAKEAVSGHSLQSEKTLEREVVNCSSEVAAKSLALSLAKQTLSTLDEEHAKLIELSEDSGAVDQRKERVVTTTAAVEALRAQACMHRAHASHIHLLYTPPICTSQASWA